VIFFEFPYDREIIDLIRMVSGTKVSQSRKCWYMDKDQFNLHDFLKTLKGHVFIDYSV